MLMLQPQACSPRTITLHLAVSLYERCLCLLLPLKTCNSLATSNKQAAPGAEDYGSLASVCRLSAMGTRPAAKGSGLELRDPPALKSGPRGGSMSGMAPDGSSWDTCLLLTLEALGFTRHCPGPAPAASPATTCTCRLGVTRLTSLKMPDQSRAVEHRVVAATHAACPCGQ